MFEIYKKEVKIKDSMGNTNTYVLKPLSGKHLPKLYSLLQVLSTLEDKGTNEDVLAMMDEKLVTTVHELVLVTLCKSYPKESEEDLDDFVSQNLFQFISPLVEVNVGSGSNEQ